MTLTDNLIALKAEYEAALSKSSGNKGHYRDQLGHINALLASQLFRPQTDSIPTPTLASTQRIPQTKNLVQPNPKATTAKPSDSRFSLPFLPAFQGLKKLDAISQVMESRKGEVLHQDEIIRTLYGELSPADLKAERLRTKTAMYQGIKQKRWQKSPKSSSYILKSTKGRQR